MNQVFWSQCRYCRTPIVSVLILLILLSIAHTSTLLYSFGDAFSLSPSLCHQHHISSPRRRNVSSSGCRNIKQRSRTGSLTTSFVFSRRGEATTAASNTKNTRSTSISNTRGYCPKCKRPGVVCVCHALPDTPIDCGTRILILQVGQYC